MKKIGVFLVLIFGFVSCINENPVKAHSELLPVEDVTLPLSFKRDSIYEIPFQYIRPTTCYFFGGFYYDRSENVRTIAIVSSVIEDNDCTAATTNPRTKILYFKPTVEDSYIFKIWKGKDANGQSIFEETEIPVVP